MDQIDWGKVKSILDDRKAILVGKKYPWGQRYGGREIGDFAEEAKMELSKREPTVRKRDGHLLTCSQLISIL
jgi:hypothetical protein